MKENNFLEQRRSPRRSPRLYFDYAASTPIDPRVERAMRPYFVSVFGNPGSLHSFGQEAIAAVDRSRETITLAIGADFREVIFTGSATEANNLALRGVVRGYAAQNEGRRTARKPRVVVSVIEHESVLETARDLERDGVEVVFVPIDREGRIDLRRLKAALRGGATLVSIMYANNETGVVQPIREIADFIRAYREKHGTPYPLFHTDAAQAFQFLDCKVNELNVDLMTLSAHKLYGPKGIGALYARTSAQRLLPPLMTGGGQEFGFRSGTENTPLVVGFACAISFAQDVRGLETRRIESLKNRFWRGVKKTYPRAEMNGVQSGVRGRSRTGCLPNILNVYFPGYGAQELLTHFDLLGLAVSAGSACSSRAHQPSYVLLAHGFSEARARQSIRFSLGRPTTESEIDSALKIIENVLKHGKN